jgi:hypothetical protein
MDAIFPTLKGGIAVQLVLRKCKGLEGCPTQTPEAIQVGVQIVSIEDPNRYRNMEQTYENRP